MREAFVGFDSAWTDRASGAICWARFTDGRLAELAEPQPARFENAAKIIEDCESEADYTLVALDQPTRVPNSGGMRPVERVAASLMHGGVQPANRSKESMFGPRAPIWAFLRRIDAFEDPPAARVADRDLHLIEVFPALALTTLEPEILDRSRRASYNPARKFVLADWRLVAGAVRRHAGELSLTPLARWAEQQVKLDTPKKSNQDCLDAAICLIVALLWRRKVSDMTVIGDGHNGYMVTPASARVKAILEQAARKMGVPMDEPGAFAPGNARARGDVEKPGGAPGEAREPRDDLWRISSRLREAVLSYFENNEEDAIEWLRHPSPALSGEPPLEHAKAADGERDVLDLIGRLEHGIPT